MVLALALMAITGVAQAQNTPEGVWRTVDDQTGQPKAEVRIVKKNDQLSGSVLRSLKEPPPAPRRCTLCTDDRKDQPIIGMEIIRGGKASSDSPWYEGGQILDPDNGKTYRLKLRVSDDGKSLLVRGFIGPFYRTQVWQRAP